MSPSSTLTADRPPPRWVRGVALFAIAFGAASVYSAGAVLFGGPAARAAAGAYVPFVVWFNFGAGFAYAAAGFGLWRAARWAYPLAAAIAGLTLATAAAFALLALGGAAFEWRTVGALAFRCAAWIVIALIARRAVG